MKFLKKISESAILEDIPPPSQESNGPCLNGSPHFFSGEQTSQYGVVHIVQSKSQCAIQMVCVLYTFKYRLELSTGFHSLLKIGQFPIYDGLT